MANNDGQSGTSGDNATKEHKIETGGYRPLNEGYSPGETRGYVAKPESSLPKAPQGGTGESGGPSASPQSSKPSE